MLTVQIKGLCFWTKSEYEHGFISPTLIDIVDKPFVMFNSQGFVTNQSIVKTFGF